MIRRRDLLILAHLRAPAELPRRESSPELAATGDALATAKGPPNRDSAGRSGRRDPAQEPVQISYDASFARTPYAPQVCMRAPCFAPQVCMRAPCFALPGRCFAGVSVVWVRCKNVESRTAGPTRSKTATSRLPRACWDLGQVRPPRQRTARLEMKRRRQVLQGREARAVRRRR